MWLSIFNYPLLHWKKVDSFEKNIQSVIYLGRTDLSSSGSILTQQTTLFFFTISTSSQQADIIFPLDFNDIVSSSLIIYKVFCVFFFVGEWLPFLADYMALSLILFCGFGFFSLWFWWVWRLLFGTKIFLFNTHLMSFFSLKQNKEG